MVSQVVQKLFGPVFQGFGNGARVAGLGDEGTSESGGLGEFEKLLGDAGELSDEAAADSAAPELSFVNAAPSLAESFLETSFSEGVARSTANFGPQSEVVFAASEGDLGTQAIIIPSASLANVDLIKPVDDVVSLAVILPSQRAAGSGQIDAEQDSHAGWHQAGISPNAGPIGPENLGKWVPDQGIADVRVGVSSGAQRVVIKTQALPDGVNSSDIAPLSILPDETVLPSLANHFAGVHSDTQEFATDQLNPAQKVINMGTSAADSAGPQLKEIQAALLAMNESGGAKAVTALQVAPTPLATTFTGIAAQNTLQRMAAQEKTLFSDGNPLLPVNGHDRDLGPNTGVPVANPASPELARSATWVAFDRYMFEQRSDLTAEPGIPIGTGGDQRTTATLAVGATSQTAVSSSAGNLTLPLSAQILPHAAAAQSGPVELVLSPAELGQLRFEIQHRGEAVQIVLSAERGDTLDLLRRNGDQLLADFRAAGFTGASLSFGGWGGQQNNDRPADMSQADERANQTISPDTANSASGAAAIAATRAALDPSRSLNLRL